MNTLRGHVMNGMIVTLYSPNKKCQVQRPLTTN